MTPLPIDALAGAVQQHFAAGGRNLVLQAAPGAGKTTRVPPWLLPCVPGQILVLEPRRIAARLAARRVAHERGVRLGDEVGYQVRFEEVAGPRTRLRFLTEGVLTRRLLSDPQLNGVSAVLLDEFHERHLDTDLALTLLRHLQLTTRPDLCLIVMSATIDAAPIARFLDDCPSLTSEGRLFPVEVRYTPASNLPLEEQVAQAAGQLAASTAGDILVFLPGAAEIRRAAQACAALARAHQLQVRPLHGDLSPEEQDLALAPSPARKLILSTNIAESSVTIDGVTAVIDSGLARVATHSPWTGIPALNVARISRASAQQRAGRAARQAPGQVIRLYAQEDFLRRPEFDVPALQREDLSALVLDLRAMGLDGARLPWFEPPPGPAWQAAERLLERLQAHGETARAMARFPLPPRLSRLVVEAERRGIGELGCQAAAVLSTGERLPPRPPHRASSDVLILIESPWSFTARRVFDQLRRTVAPNRITGASAEQALALALLAAFPDRLARRKDRELVLAGGGKAALAESSAVDPRAPFVLALDIEDRRERGLPLVRLASAVEPEWLIDLFPGRIEEVDTVDWNRQAERVESIAALRYDGLTILETRGHTPDPIAAAQLLAEKARETDIGRFVDRDALDQFLARVDFLAAQGRCAPLGRDGVADTLASLCEGLRSFAELAQMPLLAALEARLGISVDALAPTRWKLPNGRQARVEYAAGQTPWIKSRLQDFFGLRESPQILGVPLVVHLLAPNQRPVQMTRDLAGFWERLYPQVRRELSRRYPRHAWPENPGQPADD
jgi:ATP-dependent helicase HrpB